LRQPQLSQQHALSFVTCNGVLVSGDGCNLMCFLPCQLQVIAIIVYN